MTLKIGIRNGSLAMTQLPAIEAAAKIGFASVELDIPADYADTNIWHTDGRTQLTDAATATGCEIASICVGALWQISPATQDPRARVYDIIPGGPDLVVEAAGPIQAVELMVELRRPG